MNTSSAPTVICSSIYFDGHTQRRWPVTLELHEGDLIVQAMGWSRRVSLDDLSLVRSQHAARVVLYFSDGAYCEIPLEQAGALPKGIRGAGIANPSRWYARRWRLGALFAFVFGAGVFAVLSPAPAAGKSAADAAVKPDTDGRRPTRDANLVRQQSAPTSDRL